MAGALQVPSEINPGVEEATDDGLVLGGLELWWQLLWGGEREALRLAGSGGGGDGEGIGTRDGIPLCPCRDPGALEIGRGLQRANPAAQVGDAAAFGGPSVPVGEGITQIGEVGDLSVVWGA